MKVLYVSGLETERFNEKLTEVLAMYQDETGAYEPFEVYQPGSVGIAYLPGVKGGMLVTRLAPDHPQVGMVNITGFEAKARDIFTYQSCLAEIDKIFGVVGARIEGAFFNPFDDMPLWEAMGFTYKGTLNMTMAMFRKPMEEVFPQAEMHSGGIPINEDFVKLLMKRSKEIEGK